MNSQPLADRVVNDAATLSFAPHVPLGPLSHDVLLDGARSPSFLSTTFFLRLPLNDADRMFGRATTSWIDSAVEK